MNITLLLKKPSPTKLIHANRISSLSIFVLLALMRVAWAQQCLTRPQDGFYRGDNTAEGDSALCGINSGSGYDNTAVGYFALNLNNGDGNTAIGSDALTSNYFGSYNTATGFQALWSNVNGTRNTATG